MKMLRSHRTVAIVAIGLALILSVGASAAVGQGQGKGKGNGGSTITAGPAATVTIKVVGYYGGAPIPNTRVGLYNDITGYKGSGQTDDSGCITFANVPYSDPYYRASIDHTGYRDSIRLVIVDGSVVAVTLIMYPL